MQIAIISTVLSIVLFLCLYLGFRQGIRLGMQTAKGHIPTRIEPVKKVIEAITEPPPDTFVDSMLKGHANMMAFTGDLPERK